MKICCKAFGQPLFVRYARHCFQCLFQYLFQCALCALCSLRAWSQRLCFLCFLCLLCFCASCLFAVLQQLMALATSGYFRLLKATWQAVLKPSTCSACSTCGPCSACSTWIEQRIIAFKDKIPGQGKGINQWLD